MAKQDTFLEDINIQNVILADGRHEGIFELRINGMAINRLGVEHFESTISVTGVNTIHAKRDEPVLRVDVTHKPDGTIMAYEEIKAVARSLIVALKDWAYDLSAEQIDIFTRTGDMQDRSVAMAVSSETSIFEMDG